MEHTYTSSRTKQKEGRKTDENKHLCGNLQFILVWLLSDFRNDCWWLPRIFFFGTKRLHACAHTGAPALFSPFPLHQTNNNKEEYELMLCAWIGNLHYEIDLIAIEIQTTDFESDEKKKTKAHNYSWKLWLVLNGEKKILAF